MPSRLPPPLPPPQGIVHSPSLEALAVAAEAGGDPLSGRQLGRVALLKKEFGFIRQVGRQRGQGQAAPLLLLHAAGWPVHELLRVHPVAADHPALPACPAPPAHDSTADGAPRRHVFPLFAAGRLERRRCQGAGQRCRGWPWGWPWGLAAHSSPVPLQACQAACASPPPRCCEHPPTHPPTPSTRPPPQVGDDVEYTIRRDRNDPNKLSAVAIRRAPPGAVVFESVGADLLRGVVLERPTMGKQVRHARAEGGQQGGGAVASAAPHQRPA